MADQAEMNASIRPASPTALLEMVSGAWTTQVLYVAAKLKIADLLAACPMRDEELAQAAGAHDRSLFRLMRALVSLGICTKHPDGRYALSALGGYLRSDAPGSVHGMVLHWGEHLWKIWGRLFESVMTGKTARDSEDPTELFARFGASPEEAAVFNQAMVNITEIAAQAVLRAYDFSRATRVIDVGGGYGALLAAVLRAYPTMRGGLLELPHAIPGAREYLAEHRVLERCELIEGDFFDSVPAPADVCLLKSVVHDWRDDQSAIILGNCRKAIAPVGGKVLLVERIMPDPVEPLPAHQGIVRGDINMMVATGGCERTEKEFAALLARVGLSLARIIPTASGFDLIEAVCA